MGLGRNPEGIERAFAASGRLLSAYVAVAELQERWPSHNGVPVLPRSVDINPMSLLRGYIFLKISSLQKFSNHRTVLVNDNGVRREQARRRTAHRGAHRGWWTHPVVWRRS